MTTNKDRAENLIGRMEAYFSEPENSLPSNFKLNDFSTIASGDKYLQTNLSVMKKQDPFSSQFNLAYERIVELKLFIEKQKDNAQKH